MIRSASSAARLRPRQQRVHDRAAGQAGEHRRHPPAAVREAAGQRGHDRLQRGGEQPRRADRGGARRRARPAAAAPSTPSVPNSRPGTVISASREADVAGCASARQQPRSEPSASRLAAGRPRGPRHQADADDADRAEHDLEADHVGERRRSPGRAARRRSRRPSPSRSSAPRRSRGAAPASQPIAPAHEAAPPTPWTKRATSSTMMLVGERERRCWRRPSAPRPSSTVGCTPTRAAIQPPGSPPDERARRVGGGEDAGAGLATGRTGRSASAAAA